ncbi:MAG: DUF6644 family protein [Bryobacteraceae bacterium]|jgi:hypothetical protein
MSLLGLFRWLGGTPVGALIRDSTWGFAIVETVHLLALAVLGGTILIVDLRLIGLGLRRQPVRLLARELSPWFTGSLLVMVASGIVLTSGETLKCFYNPAFRWKMLLLAAAIAFYYTLHWKVVRSEGGEVGIVSRLAGVISLMLWLSVGVAGRAIGLI